MRNGAEGPPGAPQSSCLWRRSGQCRPSSGLRRSDSRVVFPGTRGGWGRPCVVAAQGLISSPSSSHQILTGLEGHLLSRIFPSHTPWQLGVATCECSSPSHVQLFLTPWTVTRQAPLSMGFPRQKYWGGLPCPPPGDLPDPGIKPGSPALRHIPHCMSHEGNPGHVTQF